MDIYDVGSLADKQQLPTWTMEVKSTHTEV
jgi:hypothetical protein